MTAASIRPLPRADMTMLALLVLLQVLLFLVPLIVLGQAIGWPASLRLPAADILPLVAAKALAVQVGYWGYLLTACAMVPLGLALRRFLLARGVEGLGPDTMAAFCIAAGVLKTLGIVRWLAAMPALAAAYGDTRDPALRAAIEVTYLALNGYAGSVGELLGVQLVSGLWLVVLGRGLLQAGLRLNGVASLVLGAGFAATALRTLEPSLGVLSGILPPLALAWLLGFAVTLWRMRAP